MVKGQLGPKSTAWLLIELFSDRQKFFEEKIRFSSGHFFLTRLAVVSPGDEKKMIEIGHKNALIHNIFYIFSHCHKGMDHYDRFLQTEQVWVD